MYMNLYVYVYVNVQCFWGIIHVCVCALQKHTHVMCCCHGIQEIVAHVATMNGSQQSQKVLKQMTVHIVVASVTAFSRQGLAE